MAKAQRHVTTVGSCAAVLAVPAEDVATNNDA